MSRPRFVVWEGSCPLATSDGGDPVARVVAIEPEDEDYVCLVVERLVGLDALEQRPQWGPAASHDLERAALRNALADVLGRAK